MVINPSFISALDKVREEYDRVPTGFSSFFRRRESDKKTRLDKVKAWLEQARNPGPGTTNSSLMQAIKSELQALPKGEFKRLTTTLVVNEFQHNVATFDAGQQQASSGDNKHLRAVRTTIGETITGIARLLERNPLLPPLESSPLENLDTEAPAAPPDGGGAAASGVKATQSKTLGRRIKETTGIKKLGLKKKDKGKGAASDEIAEVATLASTETSDTARLLSEMHTQNLTLYAQTQAFHTYLSSLLVTFSTLQAQLPQGRKRSAGEQSLAAEHPDVRRSPSNSRDRTRSASQSSDEGAAPSAAVVAQLSQTDFENRDYKTPRPVPMDAGLTTLADNARGRTKRSSAARQLDFSAQSAVAGAVGNAGAAVAGAGGSRRTTGMRKSGTGSK